MEIMDHRPETNPFISIHILHVSLFCIPAVFSVGNTMEIIAGQGAFSFASERPLALGAVHFIAIGLRNWVLGFVRSFLLPVHVNI